MSYFDDFDTPVFYRESFYSAKIAHVCCECEREIQKKEKYKKSVGKWSKTIDTFKTCLHCHYAQNFLIKNDDYVDAVLHEGLWEELHYHCENYPSISAYRIKIGMLSKWKNKKGNLMKIPPGLMSGVPTGNSQS